MESSSSVKEGRPRGQVSGQARPSNSCTKTEDPEGKQSLHTHEWPVQILTDEGRTGEKRHREKGNISWEGLL